jgi:hypothetical protein
MMRRRSTIVAAALGVALLLAAVVVLSRNPPLPERCRDPVATAAVNVQRQLRSTADGYELELWSREPLPVRALPATLRVGRVETSHSRFGDGGSTHTIIFTIPADDYRRVATGDPVIVHHGLVSEQLLDDPAAFAQREVADGWDLWTFGLFDKSQLDCPSIEVRLDE